PFDTRIPRTIVRRAVVVVLAVRLVVLVVVGHEIVQREAVVGRDEVDRSPGLSTAPLEEVGRGAEARRQGRGRDVALPEAPHSIAELIVPLRPAGRKRADLVAAGPAIPGFGDELHRFEDRILAAGLEKSA